MAKSKNKSVESKKTPERAKVENIDEIVIELAKKGESPAKIGLILKEKYGVLKAKLLGKKITQILKENKIRYENDSYSIENKIKKIENHYLKNKQDKKAEREIARYVSLKKRLQNK